MGLNIFFSVVGHKRPYVKLTALFIKPPDCLLPARTLSSDRFPTQGLRVFFCSTVIVPGNAGKGSAGGLVNSTVKGFFLSIEIIPGKAGKGSTSGLVNSAVTALFTKLPASRFPAIPWFDRYYSIIPPFHPWSHQWGNSPSGRSCWQLFWERPVTKEPAALWIAL